MSCSTEVSLHRRVLLAATSLLTYQPVALPVLFIMQLELCRKACLLIWQLRRQAILALATKIATFEWTVISLFWRRAGDDRVSEMAEALQW